MRRRRRGEFEEEEEEEGRREDAKNPTKHKTQTPTTTPGAGSGRGHFLGVFFGGKRREGRRRFFGAAEAHCAVTLLLLFCDRLSFSGDPQNCKTNTTQLL